jgi:alpha-beta hydrolase superfamily lysophospholipase
MSASTPSVASSGPAAAGPAPGSAPGPAAAAAQCERAYFPSKDGLRLHREIHAVPDRAPRAAVLVVHGYAEHCGRYAHVARFLVERGYTVMTFDYRGHGQAAGVRGHCDRFERFADDLEAAVGELTARRELLGPEGQFFIVAHSHGGLVTMTYLLDRQAPAGLRGVAFSAPFFALKLAVPAYKRVLAQVMSGVLPTMGLPTEVDPSLLCHDRQICDAYMADPQVNQTATVRWFTEALGAQERVSRGCQHLGVPSLFMQGTDDAVVDPEATRRVYERVGHADKQWRSYPGLYHEIFNEPSGPSLLGDLESWMREHP